MKDERDERFALGARSRVQVVTIARVLDLI
jgi:hypothetical protein